MGRVSQYTSMDRIGALLDRRYEPEETRITTPFEFAGALRIGEKKGKKNREKCCPDVWYITIPEAYVKLHRIRVDDEIMVHIGGQAPNMTIDELYHVSKQASTLVIVLSKIKKRAGDNPAPEYVFTEGGYRTVRVEASPSEGRRWDLFYYYDRIRSETPRYPDRYTLTSESWDTVNNRPLPEDGPTMIFNDF